VRGGVEGARFAEQHRRRALAFEQGAEVGADQYAQPLLGFGDAVDGGEQARVAGVEALDHRRLQQFLFAAKVVEGAARAHADGVGNVARGGGVEALFDEQPCGCAQQLGAAIGLEPGFCLSSRHRLRPDRGRTARAAWRAGG
jgi:hypothetical protein